MLPAYIDMVSTHLFLSRRASNTGAARPFVQPGPHNCARGSLRKLATEKKRVATGSFHETCCHPSTSGRATALALALAWAFALAFVAATFNSTQFFKSSWESFAIVLFSRFRRRASRFKAAVVALFCAPRKRCCSLKRVTFSDKVSGSAASMSGKPQEDSRPEKTAKDCLGKKGPAVFPLQYKRAHLLRSLLQSKHGKRGVKSSQYGKSFLCGHKLCSCSCVGLGIAPSTDGVIQLWKPCFCKATLKVDLFPKMPLASKADCQRRPQRKTWK